MVAWLSEALQARSGVDVECLRKRETVPHSHDNLFHSVLGLMDVRTRAYQPTLDLFAPCAGVGRELPVVDNARSTRREHQR
jgi:lipid A ethanolaminephosphotransferase